MTLEPRFLQQRLHMRQLRLVRALAEQGSLSAAARALRLTQPALTKALQELERLAQAVLFDRLPQGVRPTATGRLFIAFAEQTLAELERLSDDCDRLAAPGRGLVALGALPVTAAGLLPRVVRSLRQTYPALELRLVVERTDAALSKLRLGELDFVVGRLYPPDLPDGLERRPMYDEPLAVLARADHPLFEQASVTPSDLETWDVVLPTFGQKLGREIEHALVGMGLASSPRLMRSSSNILIRELLHGSDTVTVAPRMLMAGDLGRGSLRVVPIELTGPARPAGLITSPLRPLTPSAELVIATVQGAVCSLAAEAADITHVHTSAGNIDGAAPAR